MKIRNSIGGIFLIAGTSIGGGMLGLPIVTAGGGFVYSTILLFLAWALMTFTALLTLEVNLCFPQKSHIISMVNATLGRVGVVICWTIYLLFLYALLATYIAGGQDVFHGLLQQVGIEIPLWLSGLLFVLLFGGIVATGVQHVDRFNLLFMLLKLTALLLLMLFISFHLTGNNYSGGTIPALAPAVSVAITSFGFSIIVPTLRTYYQDHVPTLRRVILLGSLVPLICYIAWIGIIFGAIPKSGPYGLTHLLSSSQPLTDLLAAINHVVHSDNIKYLSRLFTSVCVLTAFLCVALGLSDYIADGIKREKVGKHRWLVAGITFLPPLMCVWLYPRAFIMFLSIAGVLCAILQGLLPAIMSWRIRYQPQHIPKREIQYQVAGGRIALLIAMIGSLLVAVIAMIRV